MSRSEPTMHYVCTLDEAKALVGKRQRFWVSNCGCREGNDDGCKRSRIDLCLAFDEETELSGSGKKKVSAADVAAIFAEAERKHLVPRPFRDDARRKTAGICFCCDDCCSYFADRSEACEKGRFIEKTDRDQCNDCGDCVEVCYFGARTLEKKEFAIDRDECYGCGLCVAVCPLQCISMVAR